MAGTYEGGGIGRAPAFPARLTRVLHRYDLAVRLTPWEEERLLIFSAAELARRHRAAGIALNAPEAVAPSAMRCSRRHGRAAPTRRCKLRVSPPWPLRRCCRAFGSWSRTS